MKFHYQGAHLNHKETEHEKERKIRERVPQDEDVAKNAESSDTGIIISSQMDVDPRNPLKW